MDGVAPLASCGRGLGFLEPQLPFARRGRIGRSLDVGNQAHARIALKAKDQLLQRNRRIVRENLAVLNGFFSDYAHLFDWREPDGGCIGFIRYLGAEGVEEFTRRLLEESGVLFLPSSVYRSELGPVPENCLRVGFGRAHVPAGVAALRGWLEENGK